MLSSTKQGSPLPGPLTKPSLVRPLPCYHHGNPARGSCNEGGSGDAPPAAQGARDDPRRVVQLRSPVDRLPPGGATLTVSSRRTGLVRQPSCISSGLCDQF